jgi:hypothetical protein
MYPYGKPDGQYGPGGNLLANSDYIPPGQADRMKQVADIDARLKKYKCYISWLWFDFFLNVLWLVYLTLNLSSGNFKWGNYDLSVSFGITVLTIITCGFGLSAFNSKNGDKQRTFYKLMKIMIVILIINLVMLLADRASNMILGRIGGIVMGFVVILYGQDLEKMFRKRQHLIGEIDNMSVGDRYA